MANTTIDILFHATHIRRVSEQIAAITGYVRWLTTHRLVNPIKNKFLLDTVSLRGGFRRSATQKFERIRANSSTPSSSLPVENWIEFHRHRSWIDKSRPLERATSEMLNVYFDIIEALIHCYLCWLARSYIRRCETWLVVGFWDHWNRETRLRSIEFTQTPPIS